MQKEGYKKSLCKEKSKFLRHVVLLKVVHTIHKQSECDLLHKSR